MRCAVVGVLGYCIAVHDAGCRRSIMWDRRHCGVYRGDRVCCNTYLSVLRESIAMLLKSGSSVVTLLNAVTVVGDDMRIDVRIPTTGLHEFTTQHVAAMAQHISERISQDKKPAATYSKVLEQIDVERAYLAELYVKLLETYQRATDVTPKTRTSPKDKAQMDMLAMMPDKMLREFTRLQLGESVDDFILPDEREGLIARYVRNGVAE